MGALAVMLAACSPAALATDVTRRAAQTVVMPVVASVMPAPEAEAVTDCILLGATNAELNDLARDIGVRAGTVTTANIRAIIAKPATRNCILGKGLTPPVL